MPKQYVVVIRHGERTDQVSGVDDPTGDPGLTEHGKTKIEGAARRLQELLSAETLKEAHVRSSPFRRCRETADGLCAAGVGEPLCDYTIDNTLCEVFGTIRIKTTKPPKVQLPKAEGNLPEWGEDIDSAAARFNESLLVNARAHYPAPVVLVTHGDALMATMSKHYPNRLVYNCEFLGFLVFHRDDADTTRFKLSGADGVDWMADGPEEEDNMEQPLHGAAAHSNGQYEMPLVEYSEEPQVLTAAAAGNAAPSSRTASRLKARTEQAEAVTSPNSHTVIDFEPAHHDGADRPCQRHDPRIVIALRIATVASQFPFLRLWPDFRCAVIYVVIVVIAEVISARVLLAKLRGNAEETPLMGTQRFVQPLLATALKLLLIFFAYAPVASLVAYATASGNTMTALTAFSTNFSAVGAASCYALYIGLDSYRGYLQNMRRCT